jgi:hypothetical protein
MQQFLIVLLAIYTILVLILVIIGGLLLAAYRITRFFLKIEPPTPELLKKISSPEVPLSLRKDMWRPHEEERQT